MARGLPPDVLRRGITLREVSFGYPPDGGTVLDGVDVHLPAGAAVALVGENGAGKTTLVKLLTGMYQPTAGQVLLDGVPLADIDLAAWRERTAATFQDFVRFELLAAEAVGVGDLPRIDQASALELALRRADATAVAAELPEGLGTRLGRSFTGGRELSGGQWQRLALARGMMRDLPLLLILDEPTASLDAITEAALFERYLAARQLAAQSGAITLLVSHRFSTVRMADLIVVLDQGRIAASGDHASLVRAGGLYAELDATAVAAELPEGLGTRLGRSFTGGRELSGGQWQRLALARGMMRDLPLLLILDEPTASLDAITEAALFERYLAARQLAAQSGAITLLVSHRFSTVRMADLIVVLDQGRIAASGDHASLVRAGGLYAELYELQARAYR